MSESPAPSPCRKTTTTTTTPGSEDKRRKRYLKLLLVLWCLKYAFVSSAAEAGSRNGRKEQLTHLGFVEFQYTTCLFAAAKEMKLKRRTAAVHAGTAPGVRATEPMLMSAKEGPVVANTGEEEREGRVGGGKMFLQLPQQLVKVSRKKKKKKFGVTCCRVT